MTDTGREERQGADGEPAIRLDGLRKTYPGGVEALRGISLSVRAGEVFGLVGPNGAGKTTAVRILATLTPPSDGSARVAGLDVEASPHAVRRRIGWVAQSSTTDPTATGGENLALQGRLHGLRGGALRDRTARLLEEFGLTDAASRRVEGYSGGMRRRLDLAMGVIHEPRVLLLDEPTSGLDPEIRATLWRMVERLAAEHEMSILLTTHYMEEADRLSHRLAILNRGAVVAEGSPDDLKSRLEGERVSVELPPDAAPDEGSRVLRDLEGVGSVLAEGRLLHVTVPSGARAVPRIVGALERAGLPAVQVALTRPSLEDVYLEATGHAYRADEPAADAVGPEGGR